MHIDQWHVHSVSLPAAGPSHVSTPSCMNIQIHTISTLQYWHQLRQEEEVFSIVERSHNTHSRQDTPLSTHSCTRWITEGDTSAIYTGNRQLLWHGSHECTTMGTDTAPRTTCGTITQWSTCYWLHGELHHTFPSSLVHSSSTAARPVLTVHHCTASITTCTLLLLLLLWWCTLLLLFSSAYSASGGGSGGWCRCIKEGC